MSDIVEIVEKAKELGKLLQDSNEVKKFREAKAKYDEDLEMQKLIGEFNLHKMSMSALAKQTNPDEQRIGYHEEELRKVYDKIMESELMTAYQENTQAVDKLMADISNILNMYAYGENTQGCTGSCATCGGCSGK